MIQFQLKLISTALSALLIFANTNANATGIGSGLVTNIYATNTGQIFITTSATQSQPSCAVWGFALDLNGSAAVGRKAMLAILMAAQLVRNQLTLLVKGTCDVWGDRETVLAVNIGN